MPVISRVSRSEGILRAHGYDSGVAYSVRVKGRRKVSYICFKPEHREGYVACKFVKTDKFGTYLSSFPTFTVVGEYPCHDLVVHLFCAALS